jgi:hypothetical protein
MNPFVSHYLWAPSGVNVAQAALIPTAAVITAPLTALVGPVASYNILTILSPVLAAATAYLLCRRLVHRELPAFVGGYLFGFGTYELAQLQGHLNLTLVFLIPLAIHLAIRRYDGELSRRLYIAAIALLLFAQAGLSTELLADAVVLGAVTLIVLRLVLPQHRPIDRLALETVAAGLLAVLVASPFLYYALFSGVFPKGAPLLSDIYGLDIGNLVFPTYATWLGSHDFLSVGLTFNGSNVTEAGGYLSLPLIAGVLIWLLRDGRRRVLKIVTAIVGGLSLVLAFGSHLHVLGQQTIEMPFDWIGGLPIADDLVPVRLMLFVTLAVAIAMADWLALRRPGAGLRWALVGFAVVLLLPNLIRPLYGTPPRNPHMFASGEYKRYLRRGETVLALPYGRLDVSMLWQAETNFYFYMPEGYVSGVVPTRFRADPVAAALLANAPPPPADLGSFIRRHHVSHVVVDTHLAGSWPAELAQLGLHGREVGGVLLYAVPPDA